MAAETPKPAPTTLNLNAALAKFVDSDKIKKDPASFCKYDSFVKNFKDFCVKSNIVPAENAAVTHEALFEATGLSVERDVYRAYPGRSGTLQKSSWIHGVSIAADDTFGAQFAVLCEFLDPMRKVFTYETSRYMKYADFLKCLDAYCLQKRVPSFKPPARLLKEMCIRFNLALENNGVRDGVKGKYLLGVDFA